MNIVVQRRKRFTDPAGGVVQGANKVLGVVRCVIPQGHKDIAHIAANHEVFHFGEIGQGIEGGVGF